MLRLPAEAGAGEDLLRASTVLLADWTEASCLFYWPDIRGVELVDLLLEGGALDEQDAAWALIDGIWRELRRRERSHRGRSIKLSLDNRTYTCSRVVGHWRDAPAYAFSLYCSLRPHMGNLPESLREWPRQGALWERIVEASLTAGWQGWSCLRVGWEHDDPAKLRAVAKKVASTLSEPLHSDDVIRRWNAAEAKDAGLDFVLYRRYPDGLTMPRFFGQCASGANWLSKTQTPNLKLWAKVLDWAYEPSLIMAIPFVVDASDFARHSLSAQGLLLDRYRVLPVQAEQEWLTDQLRADLVAFLGPRVDWLQQNALMLQ